MPKNKHLMIVPEHLPMHNLGLQLRVLAAACLWPGRALASEQAPWRVLLAVLVVSCRARPIPATCSGCCGRRHCKGKPLPQRRQNVVLRVFSFQ